MIAGSRSEVERWNSVAAPSANSASNPQVRPEPARRIAVSVSDAPRIAEMPSALAKQSPTAPVIASAARSCGTSALLGRLAASSVLLIGSSACSGRGREA